MLKTPALKRITPRKSFLTSGNTAPLSRCGLLVIVKRHCGLQNTLRFRNKNQVNAFFGSIQLQFAFVFIRVGLPRWTALPLSSWCIVHCLVCILRLSKNINLTTSVCIKNITLQSVVVLQKEEPCVRKIGVGHFSSCFAPKYSDF